VLDEEEIVFRKLFASTRICLNVICRLIVVIGAEGKAAVRNTSGLHTLLCDVRQAPHEQHSHCNYFLSFLLCIRGTTHGPVSVCLCLSLSVSASSRSSTKTAERRITHITPHDSPGILVFWRQRSPRNSTGVTPCGGTKCRWGGSKSATFDK